MKKLLKIITGVTLSLAMAIGVGIGVANNNKKAEPVHATAGDEITFTINITNVNAAADKSGDWPTGYSNTQTTWSQTISGVKMDFAVANFTTGTGTNAGTMQNRTNNSGCSYMINTSLTSGYAIKSIQGTSSTARNWDFYGASSNISVSNANPAVVTGGTKIGNTNTNNSEHPFGSGETYDSEHYPYTRFAMVRTGSNAGYYSAFTIKVVELESGGGENPSPTVQSVSIAGNMSTTSYNTVQSWSNSGLIPTVTMSDASQYNGQIVWSYEPATPSAAVIANSNEEVTGLSVTATATAGGQHGDKSTTGISVSYATVEEALAVIPNANDTVSNAIVEGVISEITEVSTQHGNATYFISDDGTTASQLEIYRGKGLDNAAFANVNDIRLGDTVLVYGTLTNYSGTKEFSTGSYLLRLDRPATPNPSVTITENNFSMTVGDDDVTLHETHENVPDGGSIKWASATPSVATVGETTGILHAVAAGTSVITAKVVDSGDNIVASNSITITVLENVLSDGDTFIIKSVYSETSYYLTGVTSNLGTASSTSSDAMIFTAIEGAVSGQFRFKNGNDYLRYFASGNNNNLYTTTDGTDDSTLWTATSNGTNYFIESVNVSGRKLQFNYNSGNSRFACYATSQNPIIIETVTAPEVDNVTVYGDATANANNEISVTKDFLYEVTYVDNNNTGTSAVTVSVLNSGSTTDGAFVSTAPSNGEFSVTFTANDTFTVTVTSSEDTNKFDSITITVSNIYIPVLNDFNLYGGTNVSGNIKLVEGDYIITYDNCALNTTISSSRAQYSEITPVNDVIATSDTSIVWRIQPSGNYYTIYNASVDKYLASTGAQNKAQLLEDGTDDKSLWSVEIDGNGKFNFVNKQNDANSVNANLRKNGTYGFACYGSNTGDVLTLYRMDIDGYIDTTISTATIHGHENYTAEVLTSVDSVAIRFGASISKHTWNSIDSELGITDYGVMLMKASDKTSGGYSSIEDAYDKHTSSSVLKDIHKCQNETPFAVPELNGTTYIFTVKVNFPNDSQYYDDVIYAAPYIVADGHYYFLSEMHTSVQDLALDYYNTGYEYLSDAALTMLAGI